MIETETQLPTIAPMPESSLPAKASDQVAIAQNRDRDRLLWAYKQPRDEEKVLASILQTCRRPSFAEIAIWEKKIGSRFEKGPSVRLAEVIAQKFGNFEIGYQIIPEASNEKQTTVRVFAWDLETNYCIAPEITVQHKFPGKNKDYLTSVDDIYKVVASAISKKQRDCIFKIVPRDLVDLAFEECLKTLSGVKDLKPVLERLKVTFLDVGITQAHLENYQGKMFKDFTASDVSELRAVFSALRSGDMTADEVKNFKREEDDNPKPKGKAKAAAAEKTAQNVEPAPSLDAGTAISVSPSEPAIDVESTPVETPADNPAGGLFE